MLHCYPEPQQDASIHSHYSDAITVIVLSGTISEQRFIPENRAGMHTSQENALLCNKYGIKYENGQSIPSLEEQERLLPLDPKQYFAGERYTIRDPEIHQMTVHNPETVILVKIETGNSLHTSCVYADAAKEAQQPRTRNQGDSVYRGQNNDDLLLRIKDFPLFQR